MARSDEAKDLAAGMGARLRERRVELGLTLSGAARLASVSPSYLTAVENGTSTASLPVLSRIAHALDLTIGEFLAGETASSIELGHLGDEPGTVVASSPALQLQVAFQTSQPGESGVCPFDVSGSSVVLHVRAGDLDVLVDGEEWHLEEGDSLHAQAPALVEWRTQERRTTVVWAVAPADVA
ncbi:MAG: helix-turn-helix domain-containing protein [Nocardioidaceae bacterium]|nr:helix-turn-helix domain-containing protein [Nocardioidaceae bacterium]